MLWRMSADAHHRSLGSMLSCATYQISGQAHHAGEHGIPETIEIPEVAGASCANCANSARLVARHISRTHGAGAELVGDLAADVGEGLLHRGHGRAEDGLAVLACPAVRAHDGVERALEARHDVAREELIRAHGLLTGRPFVGAEQDA